MADHDEEQRSALGQIGAMVTIPFVLAVPPIIGGMIGRWLDSHFNSDPWVMLLLIFLGIIAGFRETYRIIQRFGNGK